jgi:hypothetical protein
MTTATSPNRRARIITAVVLALGVLLTLWFGARATRSFRHVRERGFRPPPMATADVSTLRGWMTVPYVAHTYGAPEEYLFHELEIPAEGNRNASLVELNRRYRTGPEGQVLRELQEAIQRFQSRRDPHGPPRDLQGGPQDEPPPDATPQRRGSP